MGFVISQPNLNNPFTWDDVKDTVMEIIKRFDINREQMLPGVVVYGRRGVTTPIQIGSVFTKERALDLVKELRSPLAEGNYYLREALEMVDRNLFNTLYGARSDAKKTLYVFMDQVPSNDVKQIMTTLKQKDVNVIVVTYGLSDKKDQEDVKKTMPTSNAWFFPEKLEDILNNIQPYVSAALPGELVYIFEHIICPRVLVTIS